MHQHDDDRVPDPTAAGFRLSLVGPAGTAKAWRSLGGSLWACSFVPDGGSETKRRFPYAYQAESWCHVNVGDRRGGAVTVLYDGLCDPRCSEDANRDSFDVGRDRVLVGQGLRKSTDMSPWAVLVRDELAALEARRVECYERSQRRQAAQSRRGGR